MPGGCEIGNRPIDLHLSALRRLGVEITESHGFIHCVRKSKTPADIHLDFPISTLGFHEVEIELHKKVIAKIKIEIKK